VFILPHSVIAVSIATAYFTRMSGHASADDTSAVRADLSSSLRGIGLLIVFATIALAVVSYPFARIYETQGFDGVRAMANVILAFLPGLILFSALFIVQRVFYALNDTRTPFLLQCLQCAIFIAGVLLCTMLPASMIGVGIAAATSIAGSAQAVLAIVLVRRRLNGMDGRLILIRHLQYLGLALLSALPGLVVLWLLGGFHAGGFAQAGIAQALLSIAVTGSVMLLVYLGLLRLFRNPELSAAVGPVLARLRRR